MRPSSTRWNEKVEVNRLRRPFFRCPQNQNDMIPPALTVPLNYANNSRIGSPPSVMGTGRSPA